MSIVFPCGFPLRRKRFYESGCQEKITHRRLAPWSLVDGQPLLIGGEFRRLSQTLVGPLTRLTLDDVHVDKAFMGTIGLTLEQGLTTTDPSEAYTKELVMAHARQVFLLADHSKVGKVSFACAGELGKVQVLITDKQIERKFARQLRRHGVEVVRV